MIKSQQYGYQTIEWYHVTSNANMGPKFTATVCQKFDVRSFCENKSPIEMPEAKSKHNRSSNNKNNNKHVITHVEKYAK